MRESKIGPLISFYHKSMQATRDVHVLADKLISIFPIKTNPSRLASWTRKVLKSNDTYSGKKWDVVHHPLQHSLQQSSKKQPLQQKQGLDLLLGKTASEELVLDEMLENKRNLRAQIPVIATPTFTVMPKSEQVERSRKVFPLFISLATRNGRKCKKVDSKMSSCSNCIKNRVNVNTCLIIIFVITSV